MPSTRLTYTPAGTRSYSGSTYTSICRRLVVARVVRQAVQKCTTNLKSTGQINGSFIREIPKNQKPATNVQHPGMSTRYCTTCFSTNRSIGGWA